MIKFIRRNEKRLMAIFGVFLMISFVATLGPSSCRNSGYSSSDRVEGQVGGKKVLRDDVDQARNEFEFLSRRLVYHVEAAAGQTAEWQPVVMAMLPPSVPAQLSDNADMYYLLQFEARQMGLSPQFSEADSLLADPRVAISTPDQRRVPFQNLNNPTEEMQLRQSLANFMMVQAAFRRAEDAVKISTPLVQHELAQQMQQIKAWIVDFPAKDYVSQLQPPTDEQLKQQFEQFANIEADSAVASQTNPFAFGYRYPNRIKLQYIEVPRSEVRKFIQAGKSEYDWDFEANKYYLQHQNEFPTTQPATSQPAMPFGLAAPTAAAAPTTRPFSEVREQILTRMLESQVDRLEAQIQSDLAARLSQDYEKWRNEHANTAADSTATAAAAAPASRPTTGPADKFQSFEYLQGLAQDYLNRYHVTLSVASIADSFKSAKELMKLPGISDVSGFAQNAITYAEPLVSADEKNVPGVLKLYQPSKPLMAGSSKDVYFYRLTEVSPAHKPDDVREVREQVEQDWKRKQSFELAKAEAQKLLQAARSDSAGGLESAASGHRVITTGLFSLNPSFPIENYTLPTTAQAEFVRRVRDATGSLSQKDHGRPITDVEMPSEDKVAVVEIIAVQSAVNDTQVVRLQPLFADQIGQQFQMEVASSWYDYDSLVERLGYQPEEAQQGGNRSARRPPARASNR